MATEMKWMILNVDGKQVRYDFSAAAWGFYQACSEDKALATETAKLPGATAIAALAQQRGFAATPGEIEQYLVADRAVRAVTAKGELSDAELDLVTGGGGASSCNGCVKTTEICLICP